MNEYELTVLLHPDLEMDLDAPLAKVDSIITDNGGKIAKQDNWGKKKLAYQINKLDFAVYVHYELSLPADAPIKISNTLNIADEVIRYLLVKVDPKAKKALEEAQAKKDAAKEEEA